MPQVTLMPQSGVATTGSSFSIGTSTSQVNLQFSPLSAMGFSGTVVLDSSTAPNPGADDWFALCTLVFSAHTSTLNFNLYVSNNPWIRARIVNPSLGAISAYMAY
jgi:hypothetical protein